MSECCGNCRFFDWSLACKPRGSRANYSFCNRYPPVLAAMGWDESSDESNWTRPLVSEVGFCGEWQPIPEEKPQ